MMWLQYLRQLYSLDTLDTRFIISSTAPPKQALNELRLDPTRPSPQQVKLSNGKPTKSVEGTQPSRWRTPEFYIYYFVFITAIPFMFKVVYDVSKGGI
jgi:hypothetical protein